MPQSPNDIYHNGQWYNRNSGLVASAPMVLAQSGVPVILLSRATNITVTGAITGATALSYVPSGVVPVYLYAQAGLTAGFYYARFSTQTDCQIYTDAAGTITPSGITAGAYVGGTTEVALATVVIPAKSLGANGVIRNFNVYSATNNANIKTVLQKFNGNQYGGATQQITNGNTVESLRQIRNRGSENRQMSWAASAQGLSLSTGGITVHSVDTTQDSSITLNAQLAVATDYIILEAYTIEILPSA